MNNFFAPLALGDGKMNKHIGLFLGVALAAYLVFILVIRVDPISLIDTSFGEAQQQVASQVFIDGVYAGNTPLSVDLTWRSVEIRIVVIPSSSEPPKTCETMRSHGLWYGTTYHANCWPSDRDDPPPLATVAAEGF